MNEARATDLQPRPSTGGAGPASYLVSSFDLRAGLEVSLLSVTQLSADTLRELARLRRCWQADSVSALAPLAA